MPTALPAHQAPRLLRALDALAALLLAFATLAWIANGDRPIDPFLDFPLERPLRALLAALLVALLRVALTRHTPDSSTPPLLPRVPLFAFTLASAGYLLRYLTTACGGADSYGYVSAAALLASGALSVPQPDAAWLPVANPLATLTPLGYLPAPAHAAEAIVPLYPLGLPSLMTLASLPAPDLGPYLVAPAMAAAALVLVFVITRRLTDAPAAPWMATALVAWNPLFVTYAKQPMSDVPAAAWLMVALWLLTGRHPRPGRAGLAAAASFLTRPGGLGGIAAVGLFGAWSSPRPAQALARFAAGLAPGIALQAVLQWHLFGHPLRAGYGALTALYSGEALWQNLGIYVEALWAIHPPVWMAALVAGVLVARPTRAAVLAFAVLGSGLAPYLLYFPFDHWETLRFVLPGVILLDIVAALGAVGAASRLPRAWMRHVAVVGVTTLAVLHGGTFMQRHGVPGLMEAERRYPRVAEWFERHTPAGTLVFAVQHSGSIRHYSGRTTLRWDTLDAREIGAVVHAARTRGRAVFVALEGAEQQQFEERLGAARAGTGGDRDSGRTAVRLLPGAQIGIIQIWELVPSEPTP